jgi:predicted ABC-type ATPase
MNNLVILRGASGSGKSTFAEFLKSLGGFSHHFETDNYFYVDGVYKFDPKKLGENHAKCFADFQKAINNNDGNVILSNTSCKIWEFKKYKDYAESKGFRVFVLAMSQQFQNTHGVPEEKVAQMKKNFEF